MHGVGDAFDGDQLGADPVGAWDRSSAASGAALAEPGALQGGTVRLSYGSEANRGRFMRRKWSASMCTLSFTPPPQSWHRWAAWPAAG